MLKDAPKIEVQWLNMYGHILDRQTVLESELGWVQQGLPRNIDGDLAMGIAWFKERRYVATYWYRKMGLKKVVP